MGVIVVEICRNVRLDAVEVVGRVGSGACNASQKRQSSERKEAHFASAGAGQDVTGLADGSQEKNSERKWWSAMPAGQCDFGGKGGQLARDRSKNRSNKAVGLGDALKERLEVKEEEGDEGDGLHRRLRILAPMLVGRTGAPAVYSLDENPDYCGRWRGKGGNDNGPDLPLPERRACRVADWGLLESLQGRIISNSARPPGALASLGQPGRGG